MTPPTRATAAGRAYLDLRKKALTDRGQQQDAGVGLVAGDHANAKVESLHGSVTASASCLRRAILA